MHAGCRCTTDGDNVTGIRQAGHGREGERNGRARSSRRRAPARTPSAERPGRPRSNLRGQRQADIRNGRRRSPARRHAPRASRPRRTQRRSARSPRRRSICASRNGSGQPRRERNLLPPFRPATVAEACAFRQRNNYRVSTRACASSGEMRPPRRAVRSSPRTRICNVRRSPGRTPMPRPSRAATVTHSTPPSAPGGIDPP